VPADRRRRLGVNQDLACETPFPGETEKAGEKLSVLAPQAYFAIAANGGRAFIIALCVASEYFH